MLENDLFWSTLELSSTRAIVYNWFHQNLYLPSDASSFSTLQLMDLGPFNEFNSASVFSSLYPSKVQYEVMTTLVPTIQGLRRMDGCDAAWIFSAYCWLDFNNVWSMANSASRQRRCTDYQGRNGAVYLEAVLRNVNWDQWTACWGDAFAVGIRDALMRTSAGQAWLTKLVADSTLTASQEAVYWSDYGITRFTTQWQNFKSIGLVETFDISLPLQSSYAFTIKSVASEMHIDKSSSFKLYWGLANDLAAIMSNSTSIGGRSLLRNSVNYALQNVTLGTILVESGVVQSPRGQWLHLVESTLGPFGSIDARHIACPNSLVTLVRRIHGIVTAAILKNPSGLAVDGINSAQTMELQLSWPNRSWQLSAGNLLCDDTKVFGAIDHTLKASFTTDGTCGGVKSSFIYASQFQVLFAGLAWHMQWPSQVLDVNAVCDFSTNTCLDAMTNSIKWIKTVVVDDINTPQSLVRAVVRDAANVSMVQFEAASQQLVQLFVFRSGAQVDYTGWLLMYDWAVGVRELVAFAGDATQLTVLSDYTVPAKLAMTNHMVLPQRLTYYARYAIMYSSVILAAVALAICCTVVAMASKGHLVESENLFLFNRVAGMVWVGRPLLYLRGVVAIALLSAASMKESRHGMVTVISSASLPDVLQTLVRSIEVCWLVFVTQDVLTLWSDQYTYVYASKASLIVLGVTFLWSLARPVRPVVTVGDSRVCEAIVVDFELACRSGELAIGSFSRAITLCSLVVGSISLCYFLQSFHRGRVQRASSSLFLSSSANHFFRQKAKWTWNGVHYVDRASVLLSGLVVFWTTHDTIHFLDIKTWRRYVIPRPSMDDDSSTVPSRFTHSIPMLG